jgi:hypothetical protein
MSWLDAYFGKVFSNGSAVELGGGFDFLTPLTAAYNEATKRVQLGVSAAELITLLAGAGYPPEPAPADDGRVLYASAGGYALSSTVKIQNGGAGLSLGSNPASYSGPTVMAWSSDNRLVGKTAGGSATTLFYWTGSDAISIGSSLNVTGMSLNTASGSISFNPAGVFSASVTSTALNLAFGGTVATSGTVRMCSGNSIVFRNNASTGNFIGMQANTSDEIVLGDDINITNMILRVAATRSFDFREAGVAIFNVNATRIDAKALELRFGTNPATGAKINVAHAVTVISGRDFANTGNATFLRWGAGGNNRLDFGGSNVEHIVSDVANGFSHFWRVNGSDAMSVSSSVLAIAAGVEARFGTNPATGARINVANNVSILEARNAANSADIGILSVSGSDSVTLGHATAGPTQLLYAVTTSHRFFVNNVEEYTATDSAFNFRDNALIQGTNPASAGDHRVYHGFLWNGRNSANSADRVIALWGGVADTLALGDVSATETIIRGATSTIQAGATVRFRVNSTGMGFFAATPVAKPTVSGSRGGNAALASLLTGLAALGLVTDSSTA